MAAIRRTGGMGGPDVDGDDGSGFMPAGPKGMAGIRAKINQPKKAMPPKKGRKKAKR